MPQREKRSVSMPAELADAVDKAALADGTTFSAWLALAADHALRLRAGRVALEAWEAEHGALTPEERASGRARARELLGRAGGRETRTA